ncbi:hypothetical protein AYO44_07315 [Planctomycetaceae bacterium SCGC AG-212-F19]|nr:hypothetical protein AYO44_07315 [Planctomycetaceae bacterium SCGC AG-212-F19]
MFTLKRQLFLTLLVLAAAGLGGPGQPVATAQHFRVLPVVPTPFAPYYYYYPRAYPYYPGYVSPGLYPSPLYSPYAYSSYGYGSNYGYGMYTDPSGDYLRGAAKVIDSQGQYLKNVQEAYLLREQVKGKEIENRRKAVEQALWEKSNVPSAADERERAQREELRRSLDQPPVTEIWTGGALNDILANLQDFRSKGVEGPAVALDAQTLRGINVGPGKGPAAPAILKQATLNWPASLRTLPPENETRALLFQIDGLLGAAKKQALARGRVDTGLTRELERNIETLRTNLTGQINDMSFAKYTEAKRFLRYLEDAVKVLQQPDAGDYLNGTYTTKGDTVKDLVKYMTDVGLRFGPAGDGEEAAYNALHRALVQYHQAVTKQVPAR